MTNDEIDRLIQQGKWPSACASPTLIETHISWVILCDDVVFKIKKPMQYPFLDFSTLERRKFFCEREVDLNRRLASEMYLGVVPIRYDSGRLCMGGPAGVVVDYAVQMKRMDSTKEMDVLLKQGKVAKLEIHNLASRIAEFHKNAPVIRNKDPFDIHDKFNDLLTVRGYLRDQLGPGIAGVIDEAIHATNAFFDAHMQLLKRRVEEGFIRDGHGDLHSRNIFLYDEPVIFDCIEFNDDYRQTDVLNEVAFLCMDLDAFDRPDLSALFIESYNGLFPSMRNMEEEFLFRIFKAHRANVRAKVNALRAKSAGDDIQRRQALAEAERYLQLMLLYLD